MGNATYFWHWEIAVWLDLVAGAGLKLSYAYNLLIAESCAGAIRRREADCPREVGLAAMLWQCLIRRAKYNGVGMSASNGF